MAVSTAGVSRIARCRLSRIVASRRITSIPYQKLVPVTHILTNLKTAGMNRERYLELLDQI